MLKTSPSFKKFVILIFILICFTFSAYSEASVEVFRLHSRNINKQTSVAINNAIFTFIKELKHYKIIDMRASVWNEDKTSDKYDYIFGGDIIGLKDGIKVELILKGSSDEITRKINKVYRNSNLILLDSRVLVAQLFDMSFALQSVDSKLPEGIDNKLDEDFLPVKDLSVLSGSWKGDEGIERVEIMRKGRAIAVLSSGALLSLQMTLNDGFLCIKQVSAPLARQFFNLPDKIAKKAAKLGKTPTWKFKVSPDNKTLLGIKTDIKIQYNESDIISSKQVQVAVTWSKE